METVRIKDDTFDVDLAATSWTFPESRAIHRSTGLLPGEFRRAIVDNHPAAWAAVAWLTLTRAGRSADLDALDGLTWGDVDIVPPDIDVTDGDVAGEGDPTPAETGTSTASADASSPESSCGPPSDSTASTG